MQPDDAPLPAPSPPSLQDKLWRLGKSFLISLGGFVVGFLSTYSWEDGLDLVALKAAFFTAFGAWFVNTIKELGPEVRKLFASAAAVLLLVATLMLAGCHRHDDCCPEECCPCPDQPGCNQYRGDLFAVTTDSGDHVVLVVQVFNHATQCSDYCLVCVDDDAHELLRQLWAREKPPRPPSDPPEAFDDPA